MLTNKQQAVLDYIRQVQHETGLIPSTREIQQHFNFASQTSAMNYLKALEREGAIKRRHGIARGVMLPELEHRPSPVREIPIHGMIPAGMSTLEEEVQEGCISVDLEMFHIPKNARTFALRVRGESMIDAHICDGDIVVMEFREPKIGDIVAALIDGETTLKRYVKERGRPYLRAENPDYPELLPTRELVIQGVMIALLRDCSSPHGRGRKKRRST